MMLRIGSLFAGYGGLEIAIASVLDAEVAWHCEIDKAASKVLAKHYPGVPNHGDVSKVDWTQVEQVDILAGGFPCTDVSLAGRRAGLKDGTRSGLWSEFAKAIETIQPKLVIIENVRGLLNARADIGMEYPDEILDYAGHRPVLNAAQAVLGELSDLGFDAEWRSVRASDAGAPHQRFRIFIMAWPRGGAGKPSYANL
jgi:DNA (cytosine-5)-methyltransferase 1